MTTSLHDRLAALADDAPPGGPVPELWDRARRFHRRRRAGTIAIVVVVLLGLGALGALDRTRSRPAPAPAGGTPALPQKIWTPSRWLPGTDDEGPLGQLAAVQSAARGSWTGTEDAVAGVSAVTGEYRFLDLPDAVLPGNQVALAPDGRHVAYWYGGETRESPNSGSGPVVGVGVYDTVTGEVVRHAVPTDHGLMVDDRLFWADARRLVLSYYQYAGGDSDASMLRSLANRASGLLVWEPGARTEPVPLSGTRAASLEATTGRGRLLLHVAGGLLSLDVGHPDDRSGPTRVRPGASMAFGSAVDDSGTGVAWIGGNRNPNKILVADLGDAEAAGRAVPDSGRTFAVTAWLDADHVAAVRRLQGIGPSALMSVDVRTGESAVILRYPLDTYGSTVQLATDLLAAASVPRDAPPRPLDPRALTAAFAAVALGGLGALVLWRRRVRA